MTTKPLTGYRHVTDKSGKVKVVKRAARMPAGQAANAHRKAAREEKAWKAKSERFTLDDERRLKAMQDELAAKARGEG